MIGRVQSLNFKEKQNSIWFSIGRNQESALARAPVRSPVALIYKPPDESLELYFVKMHTRINSVEPLPLLAKHKHTAPCAAERLGRSVVRRFQTKKGLQRGSL